MVRAGTRLRLMTPPTETINSCGRGNRGLAHAHLHFRQTTRHFVDVVNMITGLHNNLASSPGSPNLFNVAREKRGSLVREVT